MSFCSLISSECNLMPVPMARYITNLTGCVRDLVLQNRFLMLFMGR